MPPAGNPMLTKTPEMLGLIVTGPSKFVKTELRYIIFELVNILFTLICFRKSLKGEQTVIKM